MVAQRQGGIEVMFSRRAFLGSVGAAGLCAQSAHAAVLRGEVDASLRDRASARGIVYGAAAATYQLNDTAFAGVLAREAGILVPEYEMKRGVIEPSRGHYDFSGTDRLLAFAQAHGMSFRGHPLVWHHRNPDWLDDALASRDHALLVNYIMAVAGRYRGHMHSWDVVNEAIDLKSGRSDNLRETPWLKAFGPSYIDDAFRAARAADPHALLVYNDWGCEAGDNDRFRVVTLDFLEAALARGVPIDALGLQGHLAAFGPQVDQAKLRAFLAQVKSLGLKILVTEHDVEDEGGPYDTLLRDRAVADASRRFLDVVLDSEATVAILTWGLSDRFLEPEGWREKLFESHPRNLPLDADLARKPLWHAMADALGRNA
jgi:endo-1,4-beta-xylanase